MSLVQFGQDNLEKITPTLKRQFVLFALRQRIGTCAFPIVLRKDDTLLMPQPLFFSNMALCDF